jgi:hypothetical protein
MTVVVNWQTSLMPIQQAIWKVGATLEALTVSKLASDKDKHINVEH